MMRTTTSTFRLGAAALACAALALATGEALAAEYWLRAGTATVQVPNPNGAGTIGVAMWGYANCSPGPLGATCGTVTVPGPTLTVPPGDTTLTVHLLNSLAVPTSLVIHGLVKSMTPVWTDGTSGPRGADLSKRVRSFDAEAAPNGTADYTWSNVKPGTYLYQSGTQPQVQVQMGLYGPMTKNFADASTTASAAAYPGVSFDNQATLLYSEIDPALHAAVATGAYGTTGPTSTIGYAPKYFLVNGQPFPNGSPVISPAGNPGTTLLRLLNAGLTTHVPMVQGTHWTVVAEDGKPHPWRRNQYTALLPAAKTVDVLLTPDSGGAVYPIIDRRLSLSNNGLKNGGMLAFLQYAAQGVVGGGSGDGNVPPAANNDTYASVVGVTLNVDAGAGLLVNDNNSDNLPLPIRAVAASGTTTGGGSYAVNTNGSFSYTPPAGVTAATTDSFTYQVTDGRALSATPGTVTINLSVPSAPTLALVDDFNRANSTSLGSNWSQTAATGQPPDIQIAANLASAVTTDLGGLAIWNATSFGPTQGVGFSSSTSLANAGLVLKATGGTSAAPANYVRVRCEASNGGEVVIATMNGGSNVSVFVKQATFAAASCAGGGALSAVVDAKGLVTAFLNGAYVGGVQLPDVGAWKGSGNIGIQLQTVNGSVDNFSGVTLP